MSYAVYKTEAIVMRAVQSGEASRDVVFLTRDLGKITARAQSARTPQSKMRMQLSRYAHVMIDVVRGKSIWRLTGIHQLAAHRVFEDASMLHAFHRAIGLAEHLIRGEEPHPELYDFFAGLLAHVDGARLSGASAEGLELFGVIKVLSHLGYWPGDELPETPDAALLARLWSDKKEIVAQINDAIGATQIV